MEVGEPLGDVVVVGQALAGGAVADVVGLEVVEATVGVGAEAEADLADAEVIEVEEEVGEGLAVVVQVIEVVVWAGVQEEEEVSEGHDTFAEVHPCIYIKIQTS